LQRDKGGAGSVPAAGPTHQIAAAAGIYLAAYFIYMARLGASEADDVTVRFAFANGTVPPRMAAVFGILAPLAASATVALRNSSGAYSRPAPPRPARGSEAKRR
jgi:hypothetical protein